MRKRRVALSWLCVGLSLTAGMACTRKAGVSAPVAEPRRAVVTAPAAKTLAEQLEELRERVDAVRETRDRIRAEVQGSPALAPLREAMVAAEAAYQDKQKTDEAYTAAVRAEEDARGALQKLVQQKLEANEEARRISQAKAESKEAERDVREKLQEIRRRIEAEDVDVRAAHEGLEAASKAKREAYENEALSTLRTARDAARAAFEAKGKELEEANAELAAALKEREELRARVAELEKKAGEQPVLGKDVGARKRGFTAGPYLTGLGSDGVTVSWETGEAVPGRVEYYTRPSRHQTLSSEVASRFHRVSITGLPPATECWYRVHAGSDATPFARFRTAPDGPASFRFSRRLGPCRVAAGLARDIDVHTLRHTFGSHLIAAGVDVKTVQDLLGHSSAVVTLDVYAHVFEQRKRDAVDLIPIPEPAVDPRGTRAAAVAR